MEQDRIYDPGYKRPCFLGIPFPVRAPGKARPDRTRYDARGQEREAERHAPVIDPVEGGKGRKLFRKEERSLFLDLFFNDKIKKRDDKTDYEDAVAYEGKDGMDWEPHAPQGRDKGLYLVREIKGHDNDQADERRDYAPDHVDTIDAPDVNKKTGNAQGKKGQ